MFAKIRSFFGEKAKDDPKKAIRKVRLVTEDAQSKEDVIENAPHLAKELFWGKYPHYPDMSGAYRKLFQTLKIDNTKTIKVHEAFCGTDLSTIIGGVGPNADYICRDEDVVQFDKNIKKFALATKTERIIENIPVKAERLYFAHILSFQPVPGDELAIDWQTFADKTLSGGYIIIPRIISSARVAKKPSQKLGDNIEFYFYSQVDHTAHWVSVLEARFKSLKDMDPQSFANINKKVTLLFGDEVAKWGKDLKQLKSGEVKIVSMIYKRDDVV